MNVPSRELGRFERADSESSGSAHIAILCKTEREARWLDLVARDKPPDNLMPRAVLCWMDPGPGWKGESDPSGETQNGVRAQGFDHVSPRPGHPRRGTCPSGLAPQGLSGWIRITVRTPGGNPRCLRERPALAWQRATRMRPHGRETRTSAPPLGHSSFQVDLSAARFRWRHTYPSAAPATPPSSVIPTAAGRGPKTRYPGGSTTSTLPNR